jgi:hypothetical protein
MQRQTLLAISLVTLAACSTNPEKRIPRAAADAMTGSPWTLTAVSSLTIEGTGRGLDQAGVPFAITSFHRVMNFKKGTWIHQESREGGPMRIQTLAAQERLHHPFGFVMAAFTANSRLGNTRTEGKLEAVDLVIDGATHTLYIDSETKLPVRITTAGNPIVQTSFGQYATIHGYHLPSQVTRTVGNAVVWQLNASRQIASADAVGSAPPEIPQRAAVR